MDISEAALTKLIPCDSWQELLEVGAGSNMLNMAAGGRWAAQTEGSLLNFVRLPMT